MKDYKQLNRNFFERNTEIVAKDVLGRYLVRKSNKGLMVGKVIEVEAYLGPNDKACHAYNYKKTGTTD